MTCSKCMYWNPVDGCTFNDLPTLAPCAQDDADSVYDIPYDEDIAEIEEEYADIADELPDIEETDFSFTGVKHIKVVNRKTLEVLEWDKPTPEQTLAIEAMVWLANGGNPFLEIIESYK